VLAVRAAGEEHAAVAVQKGTGGDQQQRHLATIVQQYLVKWLMIAYGNGPPRATDGDQLR
jgi:hypothetical protein